MMHLGVHHYGQYYTWSLWLIWPYSVSHFVENNITSLLRYPAAENQDKGNDFILQGEKLRSYINHNFLAMRVDKCRHELKGEILKHHSLKISITQLYAFVVAVWLLLIILVIQYNGLIQQTCQTRHSAQALVFSWFKCSQKWISSIFESWKWI